MSFKDQITIFSFLLNNAHMTFETELPKNSNIFFVLCVSL
jgi:hypothetical protein